MLFLHGSGGNREDLLLPAAQLASRGFVTMTISQPNDAPTFRPLVVNARRALDLLAARRDVDPDGSAWSASRSARRRRRSWPATSRA